MERLLKDALLAADYLADNDQPQAAAAIRRIVEEITKTTEFEQRLRRMMLSKGQIGIYTDPEPSIHIRMIAEDPWEDFEVKRELSARALRDAKFDMATHELSSAISAVFQKMDNR